MSELAARLRQWRAQAGGPAARSDAAGDRKAPIDLVAVRTIPRSPVPEELRRLLGVRARGETAARIGPLRREVAAEAEAEAGATVAAPRARDREFPGVEIAPGLVYTEALHDWPSLPEFVAAGFAGLGDIATARLLAFDTETTGLAGGTGTRAFQIGAADVQAGRLRLRQLTTLTMAAETALLQTFATWLGADTVLVSYNGKSYDAPLLATRYRLARLANPLAGRAHLDLLHPVRRRWKSVWPNCRLATAERQLLGVVREDDLPGSEAPRAWLEYLRGGSARDLRRVAAHNAQDLRSLVGVLAALVARERDETAPMVV